MGLTAIETSDVVINVAVTSTEVYPRTGSAAFGIGQFTFNLVTGAVTGTVTFIGITAIFADIHEGIAGTNGPAILTLAQSGSDPNSWVPASAAVLTPDQINALLAGELYIDAHSIGFPDGEIRGQLLPQGIDLAVADMSGTSVVPPAPNSAAGFAAMTIYQATAKATVHIQTTGVDDATAAAVGNGAAGQTASAPIFSLMKDPTLASHWFAEGQSLTAADLADLAAGMLFVDVLTPEEPAGALRGQLSLVVGAPTPASTVTLTQLQRTIFTPICSVCHTGGGSSLPASMDLTSTAATFAAIAGVPSIENPSLLRVSPGNPDASYLVHKIEGASDIIGSQMPMAGAPLDPSLIANVRAWITEGAQNN
ncbi:CHRD domain-containing protein [Steroidobacter cummioxidans]|uniref:CHRD domain-containing protein n=1 Tax=Steroidobacter cummioxidans TaxID=1803913 RepID=UPI001379D848|nr:CHRD domain-containing protein [Steroidobacter cummioxidans]